MKGESGAFESFGTHLTGWDIITASDCLVLSGPDLDHILTPVADICSRRRADDLAAQRAHGRSSPQQA